MILNSTSNGHRSTSRGLGIATACGMLMLAACGQGEGSDASATAEECAGFPSEDIDFVVPYGPGGGFDAWARLLAPYLEDRLDGDAAVNVVNIEGGGSMRGVNQVYSAAPDGTTILISDVSTMALNQIIGRTEEGFDMREMTFLGRLTTDPHVFYVAADSEIADIAELAEDPVNFAVEGAETTEIIALAEFGVDAAPVLHEGTSDSILAVRRGDADLAANSLSSVLSYLEAGEVKPIFYIGEEVGSDVPGSEFLDGVPNAAEEGQPELDQILQYARAVSAPPNLPECVETTLADALEDVLADPEFQEKAEEADLVIDHAPADEIQQQVTDAFDTFTEYKTLFEEAVS
jgi:tripartite-type tricarboxylate transporter receptor subunit TctC